MSEWECDICATKDDEQHDSGCEILLVRNLRQELQAAREERDRYRLERDMIALNGNQKDPCVFIVMDGNDVHSVIWNDSQSPTQTPINYPSYYKESYSTGEG